MKRFFKIVLLLLVIITSIACGSTANRGNPVVVEETTSKGDIAPTNTAQVTPNEILEIGPSPTAEGLITVEQQPLLDQDGILIYLKSLSYDNLLGPTLNILIENNTNKNITVQTRNSVINDVMIETIFSCDVAAGKKANDGISFLAADLEEAKITIIKDIEFNFHIFNSDTWDPIYDSETYSIATSADPTYMQTYDDTGFVALDNHDFKIVFRRLDTEESFWGVDIYVYIENNSGSDATIQMRNVSINGFMVDPVFSSDVLSGKKAFDTITFFENDLTKNDIKSIDELSFYFHVFELDDWDLIFDSEIITITFAD